MTFSDCDTAEINTVAGSPTSPYFFSVPGNFLADWVVEAILKLPYTQYTEGRLDPKRKALHNLYDQPADLNLSITTGSCYKLPLAHIFVKAISKRFNLSGHRTVDIMTCLHEALSNAMFHGNLKMDSNFRTIGQLYERQEIIQERLSDNTYRSKRINIGAWINKDRLDIAVSDEGNGFSLPENITEHTFPFGRGLMYISTLADKVLLAEDKRTLFMSFAH